MGFCENGGCLKSFLRRPPNGLFYIPVKPPADVIQPRNAPVGAPAARQAVEFIREAHELGIDAQALERHEHLLALLDRAAVIHLVVDHQGGGFGVADVGDGRMRPRTYSRSSKGALSLSCFWKVQLKSLEPHMLTKLLTQRWVTAALKRCVWPMIHTVI